MIPCEQCQQLESCLKKIITKMYNIMGEGRILHISDSVLVILCKQYREYILISEENYVSCLNFLSSMISKPDDFCNKIQYKPYAFWKKEITSTYHKEKLW